MFKQLFPTLFQKRWARIDFTLEALQHLRSQGIDPAQVEVSPYLSSEHEAKLMQYIFSKHQADCVWGGYLEDRSLLLRGCYMEKDGIYLHLGVDFSVPAGSAVVAMVHGVVVEVSDDHDEEQGWGPRLTVALDTPQHSIAALTFAHLDSSELSVGARVSPETIIGRVGAPPRNGNWWPHLHLQALSVAALEEQQATAFRYLEAYAHPKDKAELSRLYPQPLLLLEAAPTT